MQFNYKAARIDVTPAVTGTGFRAQAKLRREPSESVDPAEEKYERDLGSFRTSSEATEHARKWAIDFYEKHWFQGAR